MTVPSSSSSSPASKQYLSCRDPAAPSAILPAGAAGGSVFGRTFRGVNGCLIASISTRLGPSLPRLADRALRKRRVGGQEGPGRLRVEAVIDVRRAACGVARDRRRGLDVGLPRPGTEEVRAPGVSITSAAVSGRRVLGDPQE